MEEDDELVGEECELGEVDDELVGKYGKLLEEGELVKSDCALSSASAVLEINGLTESCRIDSQTCRLLMLPTSG